MSVKRLLALMTCSYHFIFFILTMALKSSNRHVSCLIVSRVAPFVMGSMEKIPGIVP